MHKAQPASQKAIFRSGLKPMTMALFSIYAGSIAEELTLMEQIMISNNFEYIFIHIPRTGGSSIEVALVGKNWWKVDNQTKHILPEKAIKLYGADTWNKYFTFSFVRNPWDRMVSFWTCDFYKEQKEKGFKWFVENFSPAKHEQQHINQIDILGDNSLDFIGRFENLQHDFNLVCEKINCDITILPTKSKSNRKHYTAYYDDTTRSMVARRCSKDIEYFGYKFGE